MITPFALALDPAAFLEMKATKEVVRRLSDMRHHFSDKRAVERILGQGDPVIYRFWEVEYTGPERGLSFGITTIYPGSIGREYYMTKGHFHASSGDEIYMTLHGQGCLILQSRDGQSQTLDMVPGGLCYLPSGWGHRTANTGKENFTFVSIWPPNIEHDYQSVSQYGFPQLVVATDHGPEAVENPEFIRPGRS